MCYLSCTSNSIIRMMLSRQLEQLGLLIGLRFHRNSSRAIGEHVAMVTRQACGCCGVISQKACSYRLRDWRLTVALLHFRLWKVRCYWRLALRALHRDKQRLMLGLFAIYPHQCNDQSRDVETNVRRGNILFQVWFKWVVLKISIQAFFSGFWFGELLSLVDKDIWSDISCGI